MKLKAIIKKSFISKFYIFSPVIILALALILHNVIPNKQSFNITNTYNKFLVLIIFIYLIVSIISLKSKEIYQKLYYKVPLLSVAFTLLILWDMTTSKLSLLPLPYFPAPDRIFSTFVDDWRILLKSTAYSLRILSTGYFIGAIVGLITGTTIGWSQRWNYWIGPILRIVGPIPATAWIPLAMVAFPTSFTAGIALIAFSVWFPVTIMTSSGIAGVRNAFFEVAKTMGAKRNYLIFKVAIPAATPSIFIGLFMGLGASFLTMIVAEMLGVKAGLGWYINWAQGWAEYSKVYVSLIIISVLFSSIITVMFKIKDRLLIWQKGLIKW